MADSPAERRVDDCFVLCDNAAHVNGSIPPTKSCGCPASIGAMALAACLITVGSFGCAQNKGESDVKTTPGGEVLQLPFNTVGWQAAGPHHWRKSNGGELELTSVTPPPALDLQNESRFRDVMREEILRRRGGLVSADLSHSGGSRVGRVVAKFPQKPRGMTYEGWLLYETGGAGHRITIRFPEGAITGLRDSAIFDMWMNDRPDDDDPMASWMLDPYDKSRQDPLMKNGADDGKYDAKFPDHPLSLVRVELAALEGSLHI